jgi:transcriptional regulator with XRE-family HTH domain
MPQRKLAEAAGLRQRAIVDLETDRREPHPSTLGKLAQALKVEPADLLED